MIWISPSVCYMEITRLVPSVALFEFYCKQGLQIERWPHPEFDNVFDNENDCKKVE